MADQDGMLSIEELKAVYAIILEEISLSNRLKFNEELKEINVVIDCLCQHDENPKVVREFEENHSRKLDELLYNTI